MRPPHRSRPTPIGNILAEVVAALPQAAELHSSNAETEIRRLLGKFSVYCPGVRLRDGHLLVTTAVPSVAHHLRANAPAYLEQLRLHGLAVSDLNVEIV
jgi:hypothetical protein